MNRLVNMAGAVGETLKNTGKSIAVCESSAGGLIAAALVAVPGCSAYFLGGSVIYTLAARRALLGISDQSMQGIRASTEDYALLCARTQRKLLNSDWALAETGASGPAGNPYGDPPGHACFAVSGPVECSLTIATGHNRREDNMWEFADAALQLLAECLAKGNRV